METNRHLPYQEPLMTLIEIIPESGFALSGFENDNDGWAPSLPSGSDSNWD